MKIRVILYGTLGKQFPDHDPVNGFEVEIPKDTTVGDLVSQLDLPPKKLGLVSMDGRLVKAGKLLNKDAVVRIFHPIFGG